MYKIKEIKKLILFLDKLAQADDKTLINAFIDDAEPSLIIEKLHYAVTYYEYIAKNFKENKKKAKKILIKAFNKADLPLTFNAVNNIENKIKWFLQRLELDSYDEYDEYDEYDILDECDEYDILDDFDFDNIQTTMIKTDKEPDCTGSIIKLGPDRYCKCCKRFID